MQNSDTKYELKREDRNRLCGSDRIGSFRIVSERISGPGLGTVMGVWVFGCLGGGLVWGLGSGATWVGATSGCLGVWVGAAVGAGP